MCSAKLWCKNAGDINCSLDYCLWLTSSNPKNNWCLLVSKEFQHPGIQTKIEQHFGCNFHQIKVHQAIGRQDSMQTVIWTSRRFDYFCMKLLRALESFRIFKSELKKSKTYHGWCPFQGLSNGTTHPIWPDSTFQGFSKILLQVQADYCIVDLHCGPAFHSSAGEGGERRSQFWRLEKKLSALSWNF